MATGKELIDRALKVCQTRYALAKRLNFNEGNLNAIYRGKNPMPPGLAARIAEVAGEDPALSALETLAAKETDPAARAELARLFRLPAGAVSTVAAIVAGALLAGTSPNADAAVTGAHARASDQGLYIMLTDMLSESAIESAR